MESEKADLQNGAGLRLLNALVSEGGRGALISKENIKYGEFGKPFLEGGPSFNIAHSGNVAIAAMSNGGEEIGVDIELVRNLAWQEYAEMFSAKEWDAVKNSLSPADTVLELWVKKESVLKAEGHGLQIPFTDVMLEQNLATIRNSGRRFYLTSIPIRNCLCYLSTSWQDVEVSVREYIFT